jgi:hypothetical protein
MSIEELWDILEELFKLLEDKILAEKRMIEEQKAKGNGTLQ